MTLDELNLMLVEELAADARQPVQILAKKLGMKRTTVRDRLNRLSDEGILKISCAVDPELLGFNFLIALGIRTSPGKAEIVANQFVPLPDVHGVHVTAGHYNVLVWALIRNLTDLTDFMSEKLAAIPHITDLEIMQSYQWMLYSWGYPKSQKTSANKYTQGNISELDSSIIFAMRQDPRQTITKLAKTVGCSRAQAKANLEKLITDGVVKLTALIDRSKLGYDTSVSIFIKCQYDKIDAVAKKLSQENSGNFVSKIIGQWHIHFSAEFRDSTHLNNFLSGNLANIPGIMEFEVIHLVKRLKYTVTPGY